MSATAIPYDMEPHPITGMYNGKFGIWLFLASEVMLFGALFSSYVLLRVGAPEGTWPHHGAEILNVKLATFNTMVLIGSSVTMVFSWAELKMGRFARARMFLTVTFLLAGVFLVVKYFEYKDKFHHYEVWVKTPMVIDGTERTSVRGHLKQAYVQGESTEAVLEVDPPHGAEKHAETHAVATIPADNIKRISNFGPQHSTFLATYFTLTGLHGLHIIGGMVVILYFMVTGAKAWQTMPEKYTNRIECTGLYWHFVDLVWIFLFPVLYLL